MTIIFFAFLFFPCNHGNTEDRQIDRPSDVVAEGERESKCPPIFQLVGNFSNGKFSSKNVNFGAGNVLFWRNVETKRTDDNCPIDAHIIHCSRRRSLVISDGS